MAELVYFIGILFCIVVSCLVAAEIPEISTPNYVAAWGRRFCILAILLISFSIWGYHSTVFKYFIETEPVVKIETGLKFK